ncbi:MAG: GntR family transcriptional regulator [Chloroflexi bacterium]|nr:GntR family transcriptional regulator [Chloroflexota bacterium]
MNTNRIPSHARTSVEIEQWLEERIRQGTYGEGKQLPTVRDMAGRMHVNKNTVVRAYQALERKGYLELVRGRGAFVRESEPALGVADSRWLARLDQLLDDAKQRAVSRDIVLGEIARRIDHVYGAPGLKLAFIECNAADIAEMGGTLSDAVGRPLQGMMLADFLRRAPEYAARYDLLVTTFYHLSEVTQALGAESKGKVIGVHAMPTHDALLKIARLHAQQIGLVCDRAGTVDNLKHIIRTYHPSATITPALIEDSARLRAMHERAEAIVVTRSCMARLDALKPKAPVITVVFTIDQQSIDFLREQIAVREGAPVAA